MGTFVSPVSPTQPCAPLPELLVAPSPLADCAPFLAVGCLSRPESPSGSPPHAKSARAAPTNETQVQKGRRIGGWVEQPPYRPCATLEVQFVALCAPRAHTA